jgi:4-hydroxybenzoate polyprenyltransferase
VKHKISVIRPLNLAIIAATMLVICFKYRYENAEEFYQNLFLLIFSAILTAAAGYVVNDIYDIETDKINKPDKLVVGVHITVRQAWVLYAVLTLISLIVSYLYSEQYFLINFSIIALLYLYSAQLKGMPLVGNLVVAICSSAVIAVCLLYNREQDKLIDFGTLAAFYNFVSYIVFSFFISLIRELVKDMQDMEGDQAAGLKTYPILVGLKGAKIIIYFLCGMEIVFCGLYSFFAFAAADMYISSAIMAIITLSLFYLINRVSRAKKNTEFGQCSLLLKAIMFAGVINIIFS